MVEIDSQNLVLIKDITGYISLILLSLLYIPQTGWIYYHKNTTGITRPFLFIGTVLTIDTIIYGYLLDEMPLVISNSIALFCLILMIIAKCIFPSVPIMEPIDKDIIITI